MGNIINGKFKIYDSGKFFLSYKLIKSKWGYSNTKYFPGNNRVMLYQ